MIFLVWTLVTVFSLEAVFFLGCCIYSVRKAEKNDISSAMKKLLFFGAFTLGSYAAGIVFGDSTESSFLFGLYNIFDDMVVIALLDFARKFTGISEKIRLEKKIIYISALIDFLLLITNPFTKIVYVCDSFQDSFGNSFNYTLHIICF